MVNFLKHGHEIHLDTNYDPVHLCNRALIGSECDEEVEKNENNKEEGKRKIGADKVDDGNEERNNNVGAKDEDQEYDVGGKSEHERKFLYAMTLP